MHEPSNSTAPRWLAFYDLAKACGAFSTDPRQAAPTTGDRDDFQGDASDGFAPHSVMALPATAAVRLGAVSRL
jgi:hypothetical protein